MHRYTIGLSVVALFFVASAPAAQDHAHTASGKSRERLGTVHFETSCRASVASEFDRGIALLHSFEFGASITAFSKVVAADSTCAIAHWGIALSRWTNPMAQGNRSAAQLEPGRAAVQAARQASVGARVTERERGYIDAVDQLYADYERRPQRERVVAYERAMADLAARFPADTEAKIFYAVSLVASAPPTDKTFGNQLKAGAILEPIWAKLPDHPGLAHYIIHAYDAPPLAGKARAAAQRYAAIAPSAAHALHMPSHTFTRVGLWRESVETNRHSAAAALHDEAIGEALHAFDYAVYAYLQMRRDALAKAVLDTLPALRARFDPTAVKGAAAGSAGVFALAAIPARYALERRVWSEAARLVPNASGYPWTEAMTYFARALGAAHTADLTLARASADSLTAIEARLRASGEAYWAEQTAIQRLGAQAWIERAERRDSVALALMREAAAREDATEKSAVTPGPLAPARELLGDLLLELGRASEALAEYRATLTKEPNRYRALNGARRAAAALGDRAAEGEYAAQLKTLTGA